MFLKYDELRKLSANLSTFDARSIVNERRRAREAAFAVRPRLWAGTITDWSMYGEPYKQVLWDWPGIYERSKERGGAAIGNRQRARGVRRRLRRPGARRRVGRAIRPGEERRRARLQDDESIMGGALHEDWRPRHRLGRRPFSSGRGIARVRDSGGRRDTNGNASHQNRSARAAERSVWSC